MTPNRPNYHGIEPPDGADPSEYSTDERRAAVLQAIVNAGTPGKINQRQLADRLEVHESTISRDVEAVRESVVEHLGDDAKLTTRTLFERVVGDLLDADDWRASRDAFKLALKWNEWLGEVGAQDREPDRAEVDVRQSNPDAYEVVRPDAGEPLPTKDDGTVDYEAMGFTAWPGSADDASEVPDGPGAADDHR